MKRQKGVTNAPLSQTKIEKLTGFSASNYTAENLEKQLVSSGVVEKLADELTAHLKRHRRVVKCTRCAGCGIPYAPNKMSVLYPICKNCIAAVRIKGMQAQSNFINRTLNNFHIFLKGGDKRMTLQGTVPVISAESFRAEVEDFFTSTAKIEHAQVLQEILGSLTEVDFRVRAKLEDNEKLPQKHLVVMCVDELLAKVKEQNFDLARKNDFVFGNNGEYWKELKPEEIKDFLGQAAERFSVNSLEAKHYEFKDKLYKQFISSTYFKTVEPKTNTVLINLQNGTFEISASEMFIRGFNAADFLTYQLPFEYDEKAECPMFNSYLNRVLPEKELQDILAEYFGYVFTKGLKMEKALLLYGSGANGKSVLFDTMNALLGRENISNFSLSNLIEEHNRALIAHKLLNYGSEINATKTKDEFKNLVSTEPIQARLKYGNSFLMENYAKLCFNCNELPKDVDYTNAYFRRLLIVPFRVTIPEAEQDKTLANKIIKNELPGVFNWILDGLKRLLKTEKFSESILVRETLETYKRESDSVACFTDENSYIPATEDYQLLKDLYNSYRSFCLDDGYKPLNKKNFKKRFEMNGFLSKQTYDGNRIYLRRELK